MLMAALAVVIKVALHVIRIHWQVYYVARSKALKNSLIVNASLIIHTKCIKFCNPDDDKVDYQSRNFI